MSEFKDHSTAQPGAKARTAKARTAKARTVLQVLPALEGGGVERGTIEIAAFLVRQGWTALVASRGGGLLPALERVGARHIRLPLDSKNPIIMGQNIRRLKRVIRDEGVDLLHARSRAPAWSARAAARGLNKAFVTTYHSAYTDSNFIKRKYNAIMASGDRVIAISDFLAERVRRLHHVPDARLVRIHRGVDLQIFDPAKVTPPRLVQLAQAWHLPDGVPVIMMPGRLTRLKGHAQLISALAAMRHDTAITVFVGDYVGREAYRDELERQAGRAGLGARVRFVGACRDMSAAYMLSDLVVSASRQPEGFGRTVAEAQAMGRPVIATDHGGVREIIVHDKTGWLVPVDGAAHMAAALDKALNLDQSARAQMAALAEGRVRARFSTEVMCQQTFEVYCALLGPVDIQDSLIGQSMIQTSF